MNRASYRPSRRTRSWLCEALEQRRLLTITVIGIEYVPAPPPEAGAVTTVTLRNQQDIIDVLSSASTVAPAVLVAGDVRVVTAPAHGSAVSESDGSILYVPASGYTGMDSFTYTVEDTNANVSAPATVSVTVDAPPAPVAGTVSAGTQAGSPVSINVLSSDSATSPATLVPADVQVVTTPGHGTAVPQSDGTIVYTPTAGYSGSDSFTYTVQDSNGEVSSPGTVNITVSARPIPTAGTVSDTTMAGSPVSIDVLASDSAVSPATLVPADVLVVTAPSHGTAVPQSNGSILYTPTAGYTGADSFTYTVQDSAGQISNPGTVNITISTEPIPTAGSLSAATFAGSPVTINVLPFDSAIAPATLVPADVRVITPPSHGSAISQSNGTILYTPAAGYSGSDSFTYTVEDSHGEVSGPGTVSIAINLRNPPTAGTVSGSTTEGQPVSLNVLAYAAATLPATLVPADVQVVTPPAHGMAVAQSDGTVLYTPAAGYFGADSFTYTVQDTNGQVSGPGTVNLTINAPTPPTAGAVSASTGASAPVTINVLSSDTAAQGSLNPASVTVVTMPTHGTAVAQSDGTIIYTPTAHFTGADTFTYTVADSLGDVSAPATVSITITAPVPPVAPTITAPALGGQTNDIDVISQATGGAPLVPSSVTIATAPTGGTATVNPSTGSISYVPNAGFVGTDTFTYTVADINGTTSAPAVIRVNVGTRISSTKGAAHSLSFTDAAGGLETVSLNRGSAELFFSGTGGAVTLGKNLKAVVTGANLELSGIALSGTAANSTLSIRGSLAAPVTVGGITDSSPMGSIVAPNAVIIGSGPVVTQGQSDTIALDGIGSLNVKSISNSTISIGSGLPGHFSLTTGTVTDTSLDSAVPITSIRATSWVSSSTDAQITAPSIGTLTIAGAFDVALSLTQTSAGTPALRSARIGGVLDGSLTTSASIGSISAGSVNTTWEPQLGAITSLTIKAGGLGSNLDAGAIGTLLITGNLTGNISATSAKLIHVTGAITNPDGLSLNISGALRQLVVGGNISNSTILAGGGIASLSAASLNASTISAGVANAVGIATATAGNLGTATIGTIRLTGRAGDQFTDSAILAGRVTTASLGSVTTTNGGVSFGIAAHYVGTFAGTVKGVAVHLPHSALVSDATIAAYLKKKNVSFGDFEISIGV